jgi:hypothetical protein
MSMVRFSAACPCPDLLKGTQPTRPGERLTTVGRRFWPGFTGCGCRHVENAGAASSLNQGPDEHWRTAILSHIRRFDHVGISVADLDTVIGMPESRTRIVMLRPPDGGTGIELSSFVRPDHEPGSPTAMANELGLRNVFASRSTTSRRPSTAWLRTDTDWSAVSVSTRTSGAWPTCAGRRESSSRWQSGWPDGQSLPATYASFRREGPLLHPHVWSQDNQRSM